MVVKFLGSGAGEGIPALFCGCKVCRQAREKGVLHTRSQLLIDGELLIDFPPDTYYRALNYNINLCKVKNILMTHSHSDHFYGEDLFARGCWPALGEPLPPLNIHGSKTVCEFLSNGYSVERYNLKPSALSGIATNALITNYIPHEFFETFTAGDFTVTALPALHMQSEDCFIYLISKNGKTLLYATDTGYLKKEVIDYLSERKIRLDALIVDGTYGMFYTGDKGHMSFSENSKLWLELTNKGVLDDRTQCFITHIFHGAGKDLRSIEQSIPEKYRLAVDNLSFSL